MGAIFAPTRFSLVRISIRDLVADGKSLVRTSGVGDGGENSILTNPNFLVRISSGGVGVFHVKEWGPKSSVGPSTPRETRIFGGMSREFGQDVPEMPQKFEKKNCVQFLSPIFQGISGLSCGVPGFQAWKLSLGIGRK